MKKTIAAPAMKRLSPYLKYLKYLFWFAPMLTIAGITAGAISGIWTGVPLALVISGVVLAGLWLIFLISQGKQAPLLGQRSFQASSNALIATLAVVVILGLLNFLAARYGGRIDLTETQLFTLSPQTVQLVRDLKQPVKVLVFETEQNPQDRELLERYRRAGTQFSYEFVNPKQELALAQAFEVKDPGDVFVEAQSSKRKRLVQRVSGQSSQTQERLSEVKLTNAIEVVVSDRQAQIYFVQGHGERPLEAGRGSISQATKALGDLNFTVKPLNITETAKIPDDANVVVVAGAKKALLESEIKALTEYVDRGGSVLLMVDPGIETGLTNLLATWGVTLENQLILDVSGEAINLGAADVPVTQYGNHPITQDFTNNSLSFYSFSRPIDLKPVANVQATPLLFSASGKISGSPAPRSWATTNLKPTAAKFDPQRDRPGPLVIGAAFSRPANQSPQTKSAPNPTPTAAISPSPTSSPSVNPSPTSTPSASPSPTPTPSSTSAANQSTKESRLVVIGNSSFISDGLFGQVLNGDVFLNSLRWLNQENQPAISIRPKEQKNRRITLNAAQANLIGWTAIAFLPLFGFITAFVVWWNRR
jgi:ABC-type uncharacterized transport system involved in gliding motility auxiliary subunit